MRAPVDQAETSSTTGLTAAWRVATPAPRKIRSAARSPAKCPANRAVHRSRWRSGGPGSAVPRPEMWAPVMAAPSPSRRGLAADRLEQDRGAREAGNADGVGAAQEPPGEVGHGGGDTPQRQGDTVPGALVYQDRPVDEEVGVVDAPRDGRQSF